MSKRFPISFKNTTRDIKLYAAIQAIEEQERSQTIKDILYKVLVEGIKI